MSLIVRVNIKAFYRCAVVLPICVPILLLPFDVGVVAAIFIMSIWFAGAPYIFFAILAFYAIGRARSQGQLSLMVWIAPLVFLFFSLAGWGVLWYVQHNANPNLVANITDLLPIGFFSLVVGYSYVLPVQFAFLVLQQFGVMQWPSGSQ